MRNWIHKNGKQLFDYQNVQPTNFAEASKMRKMHEKLEFKFLKYLAEYASVKDTYMKNGLDDMLADLEIEITAFIEKLNNKTRFVVSCYTYFRIQDELWNLLDDIENKTKGPNSSTLDLVHKAICCLDQGLASSSSKINLLSQELHRLNILLESNNSEYYYELENEFREICQLTANAQQIMNLRKLVLFKERRITHDECQHLFTIYKKMCAVDGRRISANISSAKNRLSSLYPKISKKIEGMIELTSLAESFYTATDDLLETVRAALIQVASSSLDENDSSKLEELHEEFQNVQNLAGQILESSKRFQEKKTKISEDLQTHIQLKLYTVCLKLQEYEKKITGHVSNLFKCPDNFTPRWYHSQSSALAQQRRRLARSLSQVAPSADRLSPHSQSVVSLPLKLIKSQLRRSDSDYYELENDQNLVESSKDNLILPSASGADSVDGTLVGTEISDSLANVEWRRLGPQIPHPDDREGSTRQLVLQNTQSTNAYGNDLQRKQLISRIKEVEVDLGSCKYQLDQYIDAACCRDEGDVTQDYIRKLESIQGEVLTLRKTVPAQEAFIESLGSEVKAIFGAKEPPEMTKVQQDWDEYLKEMGKFESILPTLMQSSTLLVAAHQFTLGLQSKLDGFAQDSESLTDIQQEAARLQENIERHLNTTEIPNSPIANSSSAYWVVNELQTVLGTLQEAGEEAEMLATNLSDHINHIEPDEVKQSPLLYHNEPFSHQKEKNDVDTFHQVSQEGAMEFEDENPYSDGEGTKLNVKAELKRGLADLKAVIDGDKCKITGKEVTFFVEYAGFDKIPSKVIWLHNGRPIDQTKWAVSVSPLTSRIKSDCLKSVDAGQYTCRVSDENLGINLESSAVLKIQNSLDVPRPASRASSRSGTPAINGNSPITKALENSPLSLKCPLPSVACEAFDKARQVKMQWFRDGTQLFDSDWQRPNYFTGSQGVAFVDGNTFWNVSMTEDRAVTLSTNRIRPVDAGRYSCRVRIDKDAYESSGVVAVYSSQQFVEQLNSVKVYLGEPVELRCRLEPWVTGNTPEEETTITWYHFDTVLTPELQDRFGITTECNNGQCVLKINKTSKHYSGVYKCEAKNKFGICTTSCRLLLDLPVPPTVLGKIQRIENDGDEDMVVLRLEYDAVPQPTVTWLKDGQPIKQGPKYEIMTAKEESVLRIRNASATENGTYSAVIMNVAGVANSSNHFTFDDESETSHSPDRRSESLPSENRRHSSNPDSPSYTFEANKSRQKMSAQSEEESSSTIENESPSPAPIPRRRGETPSNYMLTKQNIPPVERKVSETSFSKPPEKKNGIKTDPPPRSTTPNFSSSDELNRNQDNSKSFLLRPQSITANVGETAVFSCVIRPPPGGPRIQRISWRHKNCELERKGNESPRVTVKANDPCDGVFQLKLANITEGDHGDYEVVALDQDDVEICSATFHLSVDEINPSPRLSLELNYALPKSPSHPEIINQSSFAVSPGEDGIIYRRNYYRRYLIESHGRNPITLNSQSRRIGGYSQSLPDLYGSDITHRSTTLLETFKMSPNLFRSSESYLDTNADYDKQTYDGQQNRSPLGEEMYLDSPRLPPNATVGVGERLEITCYLSGYPIPQVFWFKDGKQLNEHNPDNDFQIKRQGHVHQLIIPSAQPRHAGLWEVIGRNLSGLVMSGSTIAVRTPDRFRTDSTSSERQCHTLTSTSLKDRRPRSPSSHSASESSQRRLHLRLDRSLDKAPEFTKYFHDQVVNVGDDAHFKCSITATPKPDYHLPVSATRPNGDFTRIGLDNKISAHQLTSSRGGR
ncbi:hypothetical protein Aperf_G00000030957 [Anoplocephala perfoliata]